MATRAYIVDFSTVEELQEELDGLPLEAKIIDWNYGESDRYRLTFEVS